MKSSAEHGVSGEVTEKNTKHSAVSIDVCESREEPTLEKFQMAFGSTFGVANPTPVPKPKGHGKARARAEVPQRECKRV